MSTVEVGAALSEPPSAVGKRLSEVAEDQWFDRKSTRINPRDLASALIGFANAEGGILVIGIAGGMVEGTDGDPGRRNGQMQAHIDFCVPPARATSRLVPCVNSAGDADHLLAIEVEPGNVVHANQRDEVYLRVGDESRRLTFAQRQELLYDKSQASYEIREVPEADFEDLDDGLLNGYAVATGVDDAMSLLQARGLRTESSLTVAGCLLFSRHPQSQFPEAYIRVLRYRGRERGSGARQQLIEDVRLEGPLPTQLMDARERIKRLQPVRRALSTGGRFGDTPLVPEDAWLEGVVNAAVHRSYSLGGDHIRVEIFDDRIEVSSPGRFPGLVDLSDPLGTVHFARNPRIARVCADLNFGQELGEGIRRMFEEMRHAGLTDPVYRQTSGSVILTLLAEPIDRELEARLPEHARAITAALREAGRLSTGEITQMLHVSRPVAQRQLKMLMDEGVVEWVGNSRRDPRAYWRLRPT